MYLLLGSAHIEVKCKARHPFLLVISDGKTLEEFLASLEVCLKGGGEERLTVSRR